MANDPALASILPFLPPLKLKPSSTLTWPNNRIVSCLQTLSKGPSYSNVISGKALLDTISELNFSLGLSSIDRLHLDPSCGDGYAWFFDKCLTADESDKFFNEVLPVLATILLRFPQLLELHYEGSKGVVDAEVETRLRLLESQQPGVVFLSQELIAALLACSFFCLFPTNGRKAKELQEINFDFLFMGTYGGYQESQKNKIKCFLHYFERVCSSKLTGFVSYERKVLPKDHGTLPLVTYPSPEVWAKSVAPLCRFEVYHSGAIEDHSEGSLEVDFADEYLGGILLSWGCEQEEIRFLINPELTAGMFFLPRMADNEAIEMVGAERFLNYTGYGPTFRYSGDHVDTRGVDSLGRRMTRVIAIDALPNPGSRQYSLEYLLRELNKAYCGFLDHQKYGQEQHYDNAGVITGKWGCGVFGGDPEIKTMIQWLAASQASRPFVAYYTFGEDRLRNLNKVCERIISHGWNVGDLWNNLVDYSSKWANEETQVGFFSWVLNFTEHIC